MKLRYQETEDFLIFNKPIGLNSHAVDFDKPGLAEYLTEKLSLNLHVVSRLDQSTSGLILFAKDHSVSRINSEWNGERIEKHYLFLTSSLPKDLPLPIENQQLTVKSLITQQGKNFISDLSSKEPNAETVFTFKTKILKYYLWEAQLKTGKTHQIRLHCQNMGMPILGDKIYGGESFYRLALHSQRLVFNEQVYISEPPVWARNQAKQFLSLAKDQQVLLESIEFRNNIFLFEEQDALRWLHQEISGLKIDQYGEVIFIYDYGKISNLEQLIPLIVKTFPKKSHYLRKMQNRGDDPNENLLFSIDPLDFSLRPVLEGKTWIAQENNCKYELRSHQGLSPGLFLDQRENRLWVKENSWNKSVLNLFSYTGGFSLAAGLGGARSVETVDVSKNFVEWSKINFQHNHMLNNLKNEASKTDSEIQDITSKDTEKYFFWVQDSLFFLKMAIKKNRTWDIVICDPPTFGRSSKGVFQIEKNFLEMLDLLLSVTANKGHLLISTNYEKWDQKTFEEKISKYIQVKKTNLTNVISKNEIPQFKLIKSKLQSLDFDFPHQVSLLKSIIIAKN